MLSLFSSLFFVKPNDLSFCDVVVALLILRWVVFSTNGACFLSSSGATTLGSGFCIGKRCFRTGGWVVSDSVVMIFRFVSMCSLLYVVEGITLVCAFSIVVEGLVAITG